MESYKVVLKPSVEKDLRSLPASVVARVLKVIEELRDEPIQRQSIKLAGAEELYRIRVGNYRVIYGVEKNNKQVIIHYIRHRQHAYRQV